MDPQPPLAASSENPKPKPRNLRRAPGRSIAGATGAELCLDSRQGFLGSLGFQGSSLKGVQGLRVLGFGL